MHKTTLRTSLPYCLHRVDGRFFKLGDNDGTKIRFMKVDTVPNRRSGLLYNAETIRDRWGIDAHSDVLIYTDKMFSIQSEAQAFALRTINDFIKKYRYFDKESVHLVPLTQEDLFGFDAFSENGGVMTIAFAGGIRPVNPLLAYQISGLIEQSVAEAKELPFWEELLVNADQYLYQAEYRHCILESAIALELVTAEFIRKFCRDKGVSVNDANDYIRTYGLTGNIKVTLKLLLEDEKLPDDIVLGRCKAGITIRNDIVHKGRKEVTKEQATETLDSAKAIIQFLSQYI